MAHSDTVQSVARALELLRLACGSPRGLTLGELASACSLKAPTAHNLLRTLVQCGFAGRTDDGRYTSGPAILELARLQARGALLAAAEREMTELSRRFPEATLTFSVMTSENIRCLLRMSPDRPGQVQRPLDLTFAPYLTATAVCLQATAPLAEQYEGHWPFEEYGLGRWRSLEAFLSAKAQARREGRFRTSQPGHVACAYAAAEGFALGVSVYGIGADGAEAPALDAAMREACARLSRRASGEGC